MFNTFNGTTSFDNVTTATVATPGLALEPVITLPVDPRNSIPIALGTFIQYTRYLMFSKLITILVQHAFDKLYFFANKVAAKKPFM